VERNVVLGLGIYSAFQILNDSFLERWLTPHFSWWNSTRIIAFDVALIIWLVPLRRPQPSPPGAPVLLSGETSQRLLRQILDRMREVADELKRIGKSICK
jgi:hypothetical protein